MIKNRKTALLHLLEKFQQALKEMHSGQSFPFGEYLLSHQQVAILFCVGDKENGVPIKELTELMHVTPGAVTQFVDVLVKKKLVVREISISDRRLINIKLTPLAKKQFTRFKKNYLSIVSIFFQDFSVEELEQFSSYLEKIKMPARK